MVFSPDTQTHELQITVMSRHFLLRYENIYKYGIRAKLFRDAQTQVYLTFTGLDWFTDIHFGMHWFR